MAPAGLSVTACVFDAYGTLFDVAAAAREAAEEIGPRWPAFAETWRQKQLTYSWLRSLMGQYADFWQVTGEALDYALAAHKLVDPRLKDRLMRQYENLAAYPEVPDVLARLRTAGFRTGILSNGSPAMLRSACTAAGIAHLLDHVISVDAVRLFKPDMRVYALAKDAFGVAAHEIAFFSANGWDAQGGKCAGFNTIWINRAGAQAETLPFQPDAEAADLAAAVRLLGVA